MCPSLASVRPSSILISVVLPAPFGPRIAECRSARHAQLDMVDGGDLAEALGQAVGLEDELVRLGCGCHVSRLGLCIGRDLRRKSDRRSDK